MVISLILIKIGNEVTVLLQKLYSFVLALAIQIKLNFSCF